MLLAGIAFFSDDETTLERVVRSNRNSKATRVAPLVKGQGRATTGERKFGRSRERSESTETSFKNICFRCRAAYRSVA